MFLTFTKRVPAYLDSELRSESSVGERDLSESTIGSIQARNKENRVQIMLIEVDFKSH